MTTTTLIISTYNRPDALRHCLESIKHQTVLPNEVIVGDDGSRSETKELIDEFKANFPVPLIHVWHEDNGFRLAMIRNKCVAVATGAYIIQVDGDIILHPRFIEDHVSFSEKGFYLKGGRTNIERSLTEKLCKSGKFKHLSFFSPGISRRINALHMPAVAQYLSQRKKSRPGLGCNMSFWRNDFVAINGYDEFYKEWGGEDYDLAVRLVHLGRKKKTLKFAGIGFHLWHKDLYMSNKEKNFKYYHNAVREERVWCENGVDKYLKSVEKEKL
ncbi:MAG: glycosyltransferase family 2 protein [Marinifilaceae bacterium]